MNLGKYRLITELGRGGMGIVHLAEMRGPGGFEKLVVVKELRTELAADPAYAQMFLDEARLAARFSHRHIVQTNEVGCEDGRYFMALELLEGGTLHQIRSKLGVAGLPRPVALRVVVAVLDALDYAHELSDANGRPLGIVHRDVSPQNIFLTFGGDVKLIDFGVAKCTDRRSQTQVGIVKGSVPYMSTDHVESTPIDRRADIFGVGVLLREMLVGERLWEGYDDLTILRRLIVRDLPAFPPRPDISAALRGIVTKAMAPNRADRYPTARAMREAIERVLAETDPRGSLADLGAWLDRALASERAAFRDLVKRRRAKPPLPAAARPIHACVWMESSELHTRFSAPPEDPAAVLAATVSTTAPSRLEALPAAPSSGRVPLWRSRTAAAGALLAGAIALIALGFANPPRGGGTTSPDHVITASRAEPVQPPARAPHVETTTSATLTEVQSAVASSTEDPSIVVEDVDTEASSRGREGANDAARSPLVTTRPSQDVPASVVREQLPPNPYDDE